MTTDPMPPAATTRPHASEVRDHWSDGRLSTHWDGCWRDHPRCAISLLADRVDELEAGIRDLHFVVGGIIEADQLPEAESAILASLLAAPPLGEVV